MVADVRTIPKSAYNPAFTEGRLKRELNSHGIKYVHIKPLGGLRRPLKDSVNTAWRNASFRGFADYMQTKDFREGLKTLIQLSKKNRVVVMCAEGNPFRCHRSLIADALVVKGFDVFDVTGINSLHKHKLTGFAVVKRGKITYPLRKK